MRGVPPSATRYLSTFQVDFLRCLQDLLDCSPSLSRVEIASRQEMMEEGLEAIAAEAKGRNWDAEVLYHVTKARRR